MTTQLIRYTGSVALSELPYTGRQKSWPPGQVEDTDIGIAATLLAANMGWTNYGSTSAGTVYLSAAQIAAPTPEQLANLAITYQLNVPPSTRYQSNGVALVALGGGPGGGITSIAAAPDKNTVDLSSNTSIAAIAQAASNAQTTANSKLAASNLKTVGGVSVVGSGDIPLPSGGSTPLVNDLTTGGTAAALTAEQGKTLKAAVDSNTAAISQLAVTAGGLPTVSPFSQSVALDNFRSMGRQWPSGTAWVFTPNTATAVDGGQNQIEIIPDGTTVPDISAFALFSGSDAYDQSKIMIAAFQRVGGTYLAGWTAVPAALPPTTRSVLTAAAPDPSGTSQAISWTASTGATSYQPQYKLTSGSTWTNIGSPTTTLGASISGLTASTSYDYRVTPSNANGAGPVSATVTAATGATTVLSVLFEDGFNNGSNGTAAMAGRIPNLSNAEGNSWQGGGGGDFVYLGSNGVAAITHGGPGNGRNTYQIATRSNYTFTARFWLVSSSDTAVIGFHDNCSTTAATFYYAKVSTSGITVGRYLNGSDVGDAIVPGGNFLATTAWAGAASPGATLAAVIDASGNCQLQVNGTNIGPSFALPGSTGKGISVGSGGTGSGGIGLQYAKVQ